MKISISIIRTKNFTAKAIHLGMWLWAKLRGLPVIKCHNHCQVRFGEFTSGAIAKGVKTMFWLDYVESHDGKYFEWIDYWIDTTPEQWTAIKAYLKEAENTPYEFENFWYHLVKIITGKWKGSKTTRQTYCYEHGLRVLKLMGYDVDIFMNPYEFRVWADKNLKQ